MLGETDAFESAGNLFGQRRKRFLEFEIPIALVIVEIYFRIQKWNERLCC